MTILALDTSSQAASCAVLRDGELAGEFFANVGLTHSQTALPMVAALLEQVRLTLADIDVFAVCTGPGSFTGLRIGIATVKGFALAGDKPCVGVSTLHTLANGACMHEGYICPVLDARREQVYTALFEGDGKQVRRVWEDEAIPIAQLGERLSELSSRIVLVGDGAHKCLDALGGKLALPPERFVHQRASALAAAAHDMAARGQLHSADDLAPSYLRLPQAERERNIKAQN